MAKKTAKAKAKPKDGNGKGRKAEKPTQEKLSDQERQKLLFKHKRIIKPLLAYKKEAGDDVTQAYEIAKKEGITKKEIEFAIQCETGEGIAAINLDLEMRHRVARWSGISKQLELFGGKDDATKTERLFEDGRIAALNDLPVKPPAHLAQKDAQVWLDGHATGRTSLNEQRAQGFRPLGDVAKGIVPDAAQNGTAEHPAPIGTEEPTHQVAH